MHPPYPTTAHTIPMPPDGVYVEPPPRAGLARAATDDRRLLYPSSPAGAGAGALAPPRGHALHRSKSAYYERPRERSRSHYGDGDRYDRYDDRPPPPRRAREGHVAASLAGAVAGGLLGRETSKGDHIATVIGAVVGAVGANVAEREWDRHKRKDWREEERWEAKWGRR
jgi:hypothetical protein